MKKILLGMFFAVLIISCADDKKNVEEKKADAKDTIKIGVSTFDYADQFPRLIVDAMESKAKEIGNIELTILDAKNDANLQITQVESMISTGIDGIILLQVDQSAFATASRSVKEANLPLVAVNRPPTLEDEKFMDVFTGMRGEEVGGIQAEKFIEDMKEAGRLDDLELEVAILWGSIGAAEQISRTESLIEALSKYPNVKIVREQTAQWNRGLAVNVVENWLQADHDNKTRAIFANNDEMAIGGILAAEQSDRLDIKFYGVDAIPDALKYVENGRLSLTVKQDAVAMGETGLLAMYDIIMEKPLENLVDGKYLWIPAIGVDKENLSQHK